MCPVCTVAVVGGLGLSRWFGVDDTLSGIWIGGVLISSSLWLSNWIKNKYKERIKEKVVNKIDLLCVSLTYLIVFIPLTYSEILGHPLNTLWGVDKIVLGSSVGTGLFLLAILADKKIRKIKGRQLFAYQKVVFPVSFLILGSIAFYFLSNSL